jgi:hypothetical protein
MSDVTWMTLTVVAFGLSCFIVGMIFGYVLFSPNNQPPRNFPPSDSTRAQDG